MTVIGGVAIYITWYMVTRLFVLLMIITRTIVIPPDQLGQSAILAAIPVLPEVIGMAALWGGCIALTIIAAGPVSALGGYLANRATVLIRQTEHKYAIYTDQPLKIERASGQLSLAEEAIGQLSEVG